MNNNVNLNLNLNKNIKIYKIMNLMNVNFANLLDTSNFTMAGTSTTISNNKVVNLAEYILDPLSVIIKLAILSNKPVGTKLQISANNIYIQEPGIWQPICRYSFSTSKTDLQYLFNPIELACKKYLTEEYVNYYPNIPKLFECAQNGIIKLSETYKHCSTIRLCLNYYNGMIINHFDKLKFHTFLQGLFKKDNMSGFYTDEILKEFDKIWVPDKIIVILNLTSFLLNDNKPYDNVRSIETIMDGIDRQVQQITF
jgi:hypothetical protein